VISYSSSDSPEVYLHRTGRTGRAGRTGTAISLISGLDIGNFRNMQNVNRMVIPERPIPSAPDVAGRVRQRVQVRLEHDLRELGERERELRQRRYLPLVEELAADAEGRLELAMVLGAYLASPRREAASPAAEPADAAPPAREPARDHERKGGGRKRRPRRRGPRG